MRVLFSPLGLSKGSLFTAIVHTRPDHVIVVTSREGAELVEDIVAQAKSVLNTDPSLRLRTSFTFEVHTVSDPFTSFLEGRELAKALARKKGRENIVNLTGGSTALQDAVQSIARLLSAKEIAVIDRRPYSEQQANPYVVGEIIEIPEMAVGNCKCVKQWFRYAFGYSTRRRASGCAQSMSGLPSNEVKG